MPKESVDFGPLEDILPSLCGLDLHVSKAPHFLPAGWTAACYLFWQPKGICAKWPERFSRVI